MITRGLGTGSLLTRGLGAYWSKIKPIIARHFSSYITKLIHRGSILGNHK